MFVKGDQVVERGCMSCVGTVVGGPERHAGEVYYRVNFNARIKNVMEEDLETFSGEQDVESLLLTGPYGDHVAFARRLTMSKLRRPLRDTVYSYKASRTDFHPYQFKPLLKFLASDRRRLLIADEVGLGKTIEAGYILQEERARFSIQRVLVVCPAKLRIKWQNELWHRFGEEFEVLNRNTFLGKALLREGQSDRGLPRLQGIVSLESLRANAVIEGIEQRGAPIDLLIVDEAHHCRNSVTKQHRVVRGLSDCSEATVLLTATPIHLGDENLFNLMRLLLPEEFDRFDVFQDRLRSNRFVVEAETTLRRGGDSWRERSLAALTELAHSPHGDRYANNPLYKETVELLKCDGELVRPQLLDLQENLATLNVLTPIMNRTRKREVFPDAAKRVAHVVRVAFSPEEQSVYERLSEFCFERYMRFHGDFAARFALITLQRQLASSLQAALGHYEQLTTAEQTDDGIDEDLDDADEDEDKESETAWRLRTDPEFEELVRSCRETLGLRDAKLKALINILKSQPKVVVFSYFKRSLRYLEKQLADAGLKCVRIDGDVPTNPEDPSNDERIRRIEQFRDDEYIQILLSSEVGSEGLDFQFCNVVVNWDLPWNPMVVEQRVGRVDRLGQKAEKILVFSFSCPGTIEDMILDRLYIRIGVFERTIGVLEPILGQEIRSLTKDLFNPRLTAQEREAIIEQKALALAQRVRDEERLEAESANLVGHDEYFDEQIDRVRRLGRFVTGDELRIFVGQYLEAEHAKCRLRPRGADGLDDWQNESARLFEMNVTEALRDFVRMPLPRTDPDVQRFLERSARNRLTVTFDNEQAMTHSRSELVTSSHPLVRAIAKRYDDNPSLVHPVTAVLVQSTAVAPGEYLFLWASIEETGIRRGRSLWAVVVPVDGSGPVDPEAAEVLLHQMVLAGERWRDFEAPPQEFTDKLLQRAKSHLIERQATYRREVRDRNATRVDQRLGSFESSYRAKRQEREKRLEESRLRKRERAVPLFEAQVRKLDAEYEERCRQLEESRSISVSSAVEGAGYVRVVA